MRHHHDDAWFHRTRAFAELSWQFTASLRDRLSHDDGLRPSFLGHILVELLLDAALIQAQPHRLGAIIETLDRLDADLIAWVVNQMAPRPAAQLAAFITRFSAERFLYDYAAGCQTAVPSEHGHATRRSARVARATLPTGFPQHGSRCSNACPNCWMSNP